MKKNVPQIIVFDDLPKKEKPKKRKLKKQKPKKRVKNLKNNKKPVIIINPIEKHNVNDIIDGFSLKNIDLTLDKNIETEQLENNLNNNETNKIVLTDDVVPKNDIKLIDDKIEPIELLNDKPSNNDDVLLEVINLKKQYTKKAKPAIDKLNFKVFRGQFHAFIGANGAGKTTTIKSVVGAYANFEGQVKICGLSNKEKMSKAKLGYIPEIARFPARISAFNYLKSMAMLNRLSAEEAENFTKNILIEFKMYDLKDVSPNKFSSGQKKKILLGQALSNDPDILIMDEPAANLDPKARIDFFNILKKLQKQGKSIFISSHILSELDLYADSLTILDGGKIVFTGKRQQEMHMGNKFAYRVNLVKNDDFGNYPLSDFSFEQDVEEPKHYIVSTNKKEKIEEFLSYLVKNNKVTKIELYQLTIEDMYKKYVVLGSVHTGYKLNVNSSLKEKK